MKLHRLEVEGFGPFRAAQTVDFDAFDQDGIFLISGRTGSGKSSILDAVCFALFGSVPRYESSEKRIRSDHSTPSDVTRVSLEFTAAAGRWRVSRSPDYERPKARGAGLTTVPHAAQLDELVGGEWQTRAARPRDVAHLLDEIVGLNQQQFLQVILLAQGRFAQFLLAKNDERQTLLRTLFGTRVYQDYQAALEERRKNAARALERAADGARMLLAEAHLLIDEHLLGGDAPAAPDDPYAGVQRAVERAAYRSETLARDADAAEDRHALAAAALGSLTALRARQVERARSRVAMDALEEAEPAIAHDRAELGAALAAEALRASIEGSDRSRREAERAEAAERRAVAAWNAAGDAGGLAGVDDAARAGILTARGDVDIVALRALIDVMTGDLTVWQAAADREPALRDALDDAERNRRAVTESEAALAHLDARRAELPAHRALIESESTALEGAAVALDAATAAVVTLEERVDAAREAARRAEQLRLAEQAHADALQTLESATGAVTALLRRRLAGFAGELAQSLVDGEPCAVCGSVEHPAPAQHADEPVTPEMIADAEARKDLAARAETAASATARSARQAHGEADARAGGSSIDELQAQLVAAIEVHARSRAAAERRAELVALGDALAEVEATVHQEHAALTDHVIAAREAFAASDQAAAALRAIVDAARGDFPTVAERIAAVSAERDRARDLADTADTRAVRAAAATAADADRDARVAASDFAGVDEATAALRAPAVRDELTERIRRHEVAIATERDRLRDLELELAGEPEELIDLAEAEATVVAARSAWRDAAAQSARAIEAAARLGGLATRLSTAGDEAAELQTAHDVIAGLANAVAGRTASRMDLETFVLAAELEEIVSAANLRLDEMSSGRYRLQHTDAVAVRNGASGLGLEVLDAYTGRARPPQSLSGGETFLASLALALGLAEVVTARAGGIRLDTLFVDEGFGSLDAETLDLAMRTLDELRQGGRTVGVISHVEAMKEQLPAQLRVEATAAGPSVIRQDVAAMQRG